MNILVSAPHPDDETLGCGGTLLKLARQGAKIHWLIFTGMTAGAGYSQQRMQEREGEIERVAAEYKFSSVHRLGFPTTQLDTIPLRTLVEATDAVVRKTSPELMFVPFPGDIHSDHAAVFRAMAACTKSFNHSSVARVLAYEVLSETDFGIDPARSFRPNSFCDITAELADKIRIMSMYANEMKDFPFPRSAETIRALAATRGAVTATAAAEAFMVLKEIW